MVVRPGRLFCSMLVILLAGGCAQQMAVGGTAGEREPHLRAGAEWRTDGCSVTRVPATAGYGPTGTSRQVPPADLEAALSRIAQEGPARFPDSYAGLEMAPEQVQAIVYRVPSPRFDAFLREVANDVCLAVRDAAHSAAELATLAGRISGDVDYWAARGVRIGSVGPIHDGSGVRVGTPDAVLAAIELPKRYGVRPPIVVQQEGQPQPLPADSHPPTR